MASKTYPEADIFSDHKILCGKLQVRLKKVRKKIIKKNLKKLENKDTINVVFNKITAELCKTKTQAMPVKAIFVRIVTSFLQRLVTSNSKENVWITKGIIQLMRDSEIEKSIYKNFEPFKLNWKTTLED